MRTTLTTAGRAAGFVMHAAGRHLVATAVGAALVVGAAGGTAGYLASRPAASAASSTAAAAATAAQAADATAFTGSHHRRALALRFLIGVVARDTHQTRAQVIAQLRAGRSLDDIAGSQASSIRQTLLQRLRARLDEAVMDGRITKAQADARFDRLQQRLETIMSTPGTSLRVGHGRRGPAAQGSSA